KGAVNSEPCRSQTAAVYIEVTASSQEALDRRRINIEADTNKLSIHGETVENSFFAKLFGSKASENVTLKLPRQIALFAKGVNGSFVVGEIEGPVELGGINGRV